MKSTYRYLICVPKLIFIVTDMCAVNKQPESKSINKLGIRCEKIDENPSNAILLKARELLSRSEQRPVC